MASRTSISDVSIAQGHKQLIIVGDDEGVHGSTLRTLYDGDGTATNLEVSGNAVNVKTELRIGSSGITATPTELNQLDDKTVGGSGTADIPTNSSSSSFQNKTIDGGTF